MYTCRLKLYALVKIKLAKQNLKCTRLILSFEKGSYRYDLPAVVFFAIKHNTVIYFALRFYEVYHTNKFS